MAKKYFARENRSVATYTRKAGTAPEDPELAALPPDQRAMAKQALEQLTAALDPAELEANLVQLESQAAMVPPEAKGLFDLILKRARARLEELQKAAPQTPPGGGR